MVLVSGTRQAYLLAIRRRSDRDIVVGADQVHPFSSIYRGSEHIFFLSHIRLRWRLS
ncbi:MAG: hypothetical protein KatS3mg104_2531 [Phycisphaerae bacterium]|jgi:hypothetical protein|nr:MAG: hypothetical protein KatS3mg104_2531 [Phycisphaerae bacterium]